MTARGPCAVAVVVAIVALTSTTVRASASDAPKPVDAASSSSNPALAAGVGAALGLLVAGGTLAGTEATWKAFRPADPVDETMFMGSAPAHG